VFVGPWVTAKGAGTLVDMGYIAGPVTIQPKVEFHRVDVQEHLAAIKAWPTARSFEIKIPMAEADADKMRLASMNPAANFTGTPPAITGLVDADADEMYLQVKIESAKGTTGTPSTGYRTWTFWKCIVTGIDPIPLKKDGAQLYSVTIEVLYEDTGTGADTLVKQVDT
jgi:hypothetical protein